MSLQHVLEVARKNGMPVIITDDSGREPMVIMPLEQFEAMASIQSAECRVPSAESRKESILGTRNSELGTMNSTHGTRHSELDNAIAEMAAERARIRMEEVASSLDEEVPLEEHFFIEPISDR